MPVIFALYQCLYITIEEQLNTHTHTHTPKLCQESSRKLTIGKRILEGKGGMSAKILAAIVPYVHPLRKNSGKVLLNNEYCIQLHSFCAVEKGQLEPFLAHLLQLCNDVSAGSWTSRVHTFSWPFRSNFLQNLMAFRTGEWVRGYFFPVEGTANYVCLSCTPCQQPLWLGGGSFLALGNQAGPIRRETDVLH